MEPKQIQIPDQQSVEQLLAKANKKYKLIILLMADSGLRVQETIQIRIGDLNLPQKILNIPAEDSSSRSIPLSIQIINALADYWSALKSHHPDQYLFPPSSQSNQKHLSRKMIYRRIKSYSYGAINPAILRQYFISRIAGSGSSIATAQKLLGQKTPGQLPTLFTQSTDEEKQLIANLNTKTSFWQQLQNLWSPPKSINILPVTKGLTKFHIGRKQELEKLYQLHQIKVNLLILGPIGIGKSHLLDNFSQDKIIRLDDLRYPKKVLGDLLLALFDDDKESIIEMLLPRSTTKPNFKRSPLAKAPNASANWPSRSPTPRNTP